MFILMFMEAMGIISTTPIILQTKNKQKAKVKENLTHQDQIFQRTLQQIIALPDAADKALGPLHIRKVLLTLITL